jgi:hypothetical protein
VPIRKGQSWGIRGPLPPDGVVVSSDHEASRVVGEARSAGQPIPALGLTGGDLWRTLGGSGHWDRDRLDSDEAMSFTVDLGRGRIDGRPYLFVAHVVAHSRLWRRTMVILNAQWRQDWDLGPRTHPNDGLLDVYDARLSFSDVWKVRARLPTGSHLPHPGIKERRVATVEVEFPRPILVEVDGVAVGRGRRLEVDLEPDALSVVV